MTVVKPVDSDGVGVPSRARRRSHTLVGGLLIGLGVITPLVLLLAFRFLHEAWRAPVMAQRILDAAPFWSALVLLAITSGVVLLRWGRVGMSLVAVLALVWLTGTIVSRPLAPTQILTSPGGTMAVRIRPLPLGSARDREVSLEQRRGLWSQRVVLGCLTQQQHLSTEWLNNEEVRLDVLENGSRSVPPVTYMAIYGSHMMASLSAPESPLLPC